MNNLRRKKNIRARCTTCGNWMWIAPGDSNPVHRRCRRARQKVNLK